MRHGWKISFHRKVFVSKCSCGTCSSAESILRPHFRLQLLFQEAQPDGWAVLLIPVSGAPIHTVLWNFLINQKQYMAPHK